MKKNLWIWALAAFSMAACTSEDVPTKEEQVVTENDWVSPDGQVLIQLSADGLPTPSASVGRAAIEGTDITKLDNLGIFALSRGGDNKPLENISYYGYNATDEYLPSDEISNKDNEVLLNNVSAKGSNTTTLDAQLHDNLQRIRLYANKEDQNASIYYYPIQPNDNYNFYGYFPRQDNPDKVQYSKSDVIVEFEKTDGSVDIITGRQKKNEAGIEDAPKMTPGMLYVDGTDDTKKNETTWGGYNARYIRNIKYHNWLIDDNKQKNTGKFSETGMPKQKFVPAIQFKHRTALLEFFIIANEKQAGATPDNNTENDEDEPYIDQEKTKQLRVYDLQLVKEYKVAKWNVITDNIEWTGEPENMNVIKLEQSDFETGRRNQEYGSLTDEQYQEIWTTAEFDINNDEENETINVIKPTAIREEAKPAGYLLVQPKTSYQVQLSILAPGNGTAVPQTQTTTLDVKLPNTNENFQAGYIYKIYIKLNALQEVNIHAELENWQEYGTDVDIPVE
ncbi:MAG: hypothetical protein IKU64_05815 [Bacteroides sp.]|nr:hypothetical protein [Bacteroides sp.]